MNLGTLTSCCIRLVKHVVLVGLYLGYLSIMGDLLVCMKVLLFDLSLVEASDPLEASKWSVSLVHSLVLVHMLLTILLKKL